MEQLHPDPATQPATHRFRFPICDQPVIGWGRHNKHALAGGHQEQERLTMLKLLGFPASNYYNMVKMALMEKGAEYEDASIPEAATSFSPRAPWAKFPLSKHPKAP